MKLNHIDHIVLTVVSIHATIEYYTKVLGFEEVTFGGGRKALQCGNQKINLHEVGNELMPHAKRPVPGSADLCLIYEGNIDEIYKHLIACDVEIIEGPVHRTGAMGPINSIYVRDLVGNLIELSVYL